MKPICRTETSAAKLPIDVESHGRRAETSRWNYVVRIIFMLLSRTSGGEKKTNDITCSSLTEHPKMYPGWGSGANMADRRSGRISQFILVIA
jgi:hypothetical protein